MFDLSAIFRRKNLSGMVCHRGSDQIAFVARWADEEQDRYCSQVWVANADGVRAITRQEDEASDPAWSSDGGSVAYLQEEDGLLQVHARRSDGTQPRCISGFPDGAVSVEHWCSTTERLLVLAYQDKTDAKGPVVTEHLPYKLDGSGYTAGDNTCLFEMAEADGSFIKVSTAGGDVKQARRGNDGAGIAYVSSRCGMQRHRMDLWLSRDGENRQLSRDLVSISDLSWSPDGTRIAMAGSRREGDSSVYMEVFDLDTDSFCDMPVVELASPSSISWSADGEGILAIQAFRGRQRVVCVDMKGEVRVVLHEPDQITAFSPSDESLWWVGVGLNEAPTLRRASCDGDEPKIVGDFNATERSCRNGMLRCFEVPAGDGKGQEKIEGWLLVPNSGGPFPLFVEMHGGPHSYTMLDPNVHEHWDPLLENGWAILALNAVGSSSYGAEFAHRLIGRWGELDLPQHLSAVAQLRKEGVASDQAVCFGHSYGGYLTAWALTQPGPWKGGIVSGGVINLVSHAGTSDSGYYVSPYAMGAEMAAAPELLWRLSPLSLVGDVMAPTLILQSGDDHRCPVGQGEEFHAGLVRAGRTRSRLVVYPGESHHLSSKGTPSLRLDYYNRLIGWTLGQEIPA